MAIISIDISKKNILTIDTFLAALWIVVLATSIRFILNFFSLDFLLNFIPEGFRLMFIIFVSIYVSRKLVVKFRGREVI